MLGRWRSSWIFSWIFFLHDAWARLLPSCANSRCGKDESKLRRMCRRPRSVVLGGLRYCHSECLEMALVEILQTRPAPRRAPVAHRVPLGLLLLSRQQLTGEQLRIALEAQRKSYRASAGLSADSSADVGESLEQDPRYRAKKIGVWLQELGFATEQQVTAALARQWSCPVLKAGLMAAASERFPAIPARLLESFQMMPVEVVEATRTLLMAFSQGIDYTVLYAIEQMLGYRTEPCLVCPSVLEKGLQSLARRRRDVVFDRLQDAGECARIVANYATRAKAEEVRVARCGEHFWVRLERGRQEAVTLVLQTKSRFSVVSSQ
jgi:hypothetical protein